VLKLVKQPFKLPNRQAGGHLHVMKEIWIQAQSYNSRLCSVQPACHQLLFRKSQYQCVGH